jgi:hypothetical protein
MERPMSTPELADDLLRGGKQLAIAIYGKDDAKTLRKLYYEIEQGRWPIFQLDDNGILFGLKSRIQAHIAAKSSEREARIAATAEIAAQKTIAPRLRRRRARSSR